MNCTKWRLAAATALACLGFNIAQAATTLAVWENSFSVLSQGGVTLDLQGNVADANGVITIGSKGLKFSRTGNFGPSDQKLSSNACVTVLMEVSDIPSTGTSALAYVGIGNNNAGGATFARENSAYTVWCYKPSDILTFSSKGTALTGTGSRLLHFRYRNRKGSRVAIDGGVASDTNYSSDGQLGSNILIGEYLGNTYVSTGLKVRKVAILCGQLTDDEAAAYIWPSMKHTRFQANFADRIWTARSGGELAAAATFATYDLTQGCDTGTVFRGDSNRVLPGTSAANAAWHGVCSAVSGYNAPGMVLRIPPHPGTVYAARGGFSPLTLGGLIVEPWAANGDSWPKITRGGTSDKRISDLGDITGKVESWFVLEDNFELSRNNTATIYGTVNFDIASNKVFSLEAAYDNGSVACNAGTKANLKFWGAGTLKVSTLYASAAVTLDYSNLALDREAAYVDGNLTVNASTVIKLPADALEGEGYALCTGDLKVNGEPAKIWVGGAEVTNYAFVANKICGGTRWTGAVDNLWGTAGNWSDGIPGAGKPGIIPNGMTAVVKATDDLTQVAALSGLGTVIADGFAPAFMADTFHNSAWRGTVEIRGASTSTIDVALFGNNDSTINLNGVALSGELSVPSTAIVQVGTNGLVATAGVTLAGSLSGAGTLTGDINFNGGALYPTKGTLTIDGNITGTFVVDGQYLTDASTQGARVAKIASALPEPPTFELKNASAYRIFWYEDYLCVTKAEAAMLAKYTQYLDYAPGIVTWTGGSDLIASDAVYTRFDPVVGNTSTRYEGINAWHLFCNYSSYPEYIPGLVLRYESSVGCKKMDGFGAGLLAMGAIIVEAGATGAGFQCLSSVYRATDIGCQTDLNGETWSRFEESYAIQRGGNLTFHGLCNLTVAEGKVLTLNTLNFTIDDKGPLPNPDVAAGSTLKLHGLGKIVLRTLKAENATLDYSDVSLSRSTAFVDGEISVNASTKLVLPADLAENTAFPLCTGELTGITSPSIRKVTIGATEKTVQLTVSGGSVSYVVLAAVLDGVAKDSVQAAFDDAVDSSQITVLADAEVTLGAAKKLSQLLVDGELTIAGEALTMTNGTLQVAEGYVCTVTAPLKICDTVSKTGPGTLFAKSEVAGANGASWTAEGDQLVVREGGATFDGAISNVLIRGCGTVATEADWPVITLLTNCTANSNARISPVIRLTESTAYSYYGKLIQDGATIYCGGMSCMDPCGGAGVYILESGVLNANVFHLQYQSSAGGRITFIQNGGQFIINNSNNYLNMCRTYLSDTGNIYFKYVLNDGTFVGHFNGVSDNDQQAPKTFADRLRVELNGGTYDFGNKANLFTRGCTAMVLSGEVTLKSNASATPVTVWSQFSGTGTLIYAGLGTLDLTECTDFTGNYVVNGGAVLLDEDNLSSTTTLAIALGAKVQLDYDGTETIKSLTLANRLRPKDKSYGSSSEVRYSRYFLEASGAVVPTEGTDGEPGMVMVVE